MFSTFKSRLYIAAIVMFIVFLILNFSLLGFLNKIKNRSYIQAVLGSVSISLLKVNRNAINLIYLTKLRKSGIALAKLTKKKYNTASIDKKINILVDKIKLARKSNVIAVNGFYSGFQREHFKKLFGMEKSLLKRPAALKTPEAKVKMNELKQIMAKYRPHVIELLKNPIKAGPNLKASYFNDKMDAIIKLLDFDRYAMSSGMNNKIKFLLDMFIVVPFLVLLALLSVSYYFKRFLIDELEITIKKIEDVANGDLRSKIKTCVNPKNEIGRLIGHVNTLVESLSANVKSINNAVDSISSSGEELNYSSKELKSNMENMKQNSSSIVESIKQITMAILEVAKNSSSGAQEADRTQKATEEGYNAVQGVIKEINSIEKAVDKAAAVMEELGVSSQKIGEIIAVIDEIADQTNLLALNAAIEAARAGEQGRGFAVVADEVRKLAERTTKATKEITTMIISIQEDTVKAIKSMNNGKEEVRNGVEVAKKAGERIEAIRELTNKLKDMITQIATAAEEQSTATEEISASSDSILRAQESTSASTDQIQTSALELSKLASLLSKNISVFKI
ncbi:MAG: methyl-accepting chemotaxis protein [Candidatus Acidulodesulfobacterium ferriphilum]|uniref:Methyl-accepting chemotaxis protein n=1 Tax=Candidatus Acidulodesulfobacterium ferriphilum TaxID=2597223 RepID=A0A519BAW9_9DELT|nr:MAG: methyl-accepting chemotaxis protein [Candidatus Acidulodesulfobacterium ferriphilum]